MKNALVFGGTSGLGLEVATLLKDEGYLVTVCGRTRPADTRGLAIRTFDVTKDDYLARIGGVLHTTGNIDLLVYAAGFCQQSPLLSLSQKEIEDMLRVGLSVPIALMRYILQLQKTLPKFICVTSTSQWTPRADQSVYCAAKSGLGMFADSMSLDGAVQKTLVVGVSGMDTPFWRNSDCDTSAYLNPHWVAKQTLEELEEDFSFRHIKILREPTRVLIEKTYS